MMASKEYQSANIAAAEEISNPMVANQVSRMGRLRRRLFGISLQETQFARRGFHEGTARARARLEQIGVTFLLGYLAAVEENQSDRLASRLNQFDNELRGFAFEGAAMGLSLLDWFTPWQRNRWSDFVQGPGAAHTYMIHVGVGWTLARVPRRIEPTLARMDPLLRWLAIDGYGFHEGYFHGRRRVQAQAVPRRLSGYARRSFDQGLGRSLWYVGGADVPRIAGVIAAFPSERHADLWSGVGLAAAYAGGVSEQTLNGLRAVAGLYQPLLAQSAAFAAKARQRAHNPAEHTDLACEVLCGMSAVAAAAITDSALKDLPPDGPEPSYEVWRRRVQAQFT